MERYYIIGGHRFRITGKEADAIQNIPGFEPFEVKEPADIKFTIRLESGGYGAELAVLCKSEILYTFSFDNVKCTFTHPSIGYSFFMTAQNKEPLEMYCSPERQECVITGNKAPRKLHFALWIAYGLLTTAQQTIAIHSSVIAYHDKAILFLGESGTGKSTHTRLWQQYIPETTLLNDDSPILRVINGKPYIYGSPWSGKTPCYRNERMELAGVVRLSQAPYNHIRKLQTLEAFGALYPSCPPAFARDTILSEQLCATLSKVLSYVPVWHLACLPNAEAAQLSYHTIFQPNNFQTSEMK